jgi:hypothetical protein
MAEHPVRFRTIGFKAGSGDESRDSQDGSVSLRNGEASFHLMRLIMLNDNGGVNDPADLSFELDVQFMDRGEQRLKKSGWVKNGEAAPPVGVDNSEFIQLFAVKLVGRRSHEYSVSYSANMRKVRPPPIFGPSNQDHGNFRNADGEWCGDEIQEPQYLFWINEYQVEVRRRHG